MRTSAKSVLTALMAAFLLAGSIGSASARNLLLSEFNYRVTWSSLEFASELVTIRCPVTIEGFFHARIVAKVRETLIGSVTRAPIKEESCTNGRARAKNLPFHVTYEGFSGTLPNISSVLFLLNRVRYELIVSGICTGDYGLITSNNLTVSAAREAGGVITTFTFVEGRNSLSRISGAGICPSSARVRGSGSVTLLESIFRLTVTLI